MKPAANPVVNADGTVRFLSTAGTSAGNISIGPGEAASVDILDLESADDYGGESHSGEQQLRGRHRQRHLGRLDPRRERLRRLRAGPLATSTSPSRPTTSSGTVTLWGQPFSIG